MRQFLAIFFIILLPLRGWAGESMAFQMSMSVAPSAASANENASDMSEDCPMLSQADAFNGQHDVKPDKPNCSCHSCHLCMPLAFLNSLSQRFVSFPPAHQPLQISFAYVSADLNTFLKPPIY